MIFETTKNELKSILSALSSSVPPNVKDDDMYGTVMMESLEKGIIKANTSSRQSSASVEFTGEFEEAFKLCIPFKRLFKLIPLLSDDQILVNQTEPGWIVLKNGKSKHKIPVLDAALFPKIVYEEINRFSVNIEIFYKALKACSITTSKNDKASWKLACVGLVVNRDTLRLRSCDGTQFSIATLGLDKNYGNAEVLIPQQAINFLIKFVNERSEDLIEIVICQNHLVLEKESSRLIMTLVDGVFPDIDKLIIPNPKNELTAAVLELRGALKRSQTVLDVSQIVKVSVNESEVSILAVSPLGKALEQLECSRPDGFEEIIDLGIMADQVIDFLNEFNGLVRIGVESNKKPIHFWPIDNEEFDFVYLTMPTV